MLLVLQDGSDGGALALLEKARQLVALGLKAPSELQTALTTAIESGGLSPGKQDWQPLWASICQVSTVVPWSSTYTTSTYHTPMFLVVSLDTVGYQYFGRYMISVDASNLES